MIFLQGHGVSAAYAMKIYKQYGDGAIEIVSRNPYQLAYDVHGIGFKLADGIAHKLGFGLDTPERVEAGILYCLQQASESGHCYLPMQALAEGAVELLAAPADGAGPTPASQPTVADASEAIDRLLRRQLIICDTEDADTKPIYQKTVYIRELMLARDLCELIDRPLNSPWIPKDLPGFVEGICGEMDIDLAPEQERAVVESLRSRVLVLTGGPGTGKTTTTRAILRAQTPVQPQSAPRQPHRTRRQTPGRGDGLPGDDDPPPVGSRRQDLSIQTQQGESARVRHADRR